VKYQETHGTGNPKQLTRTSTHTAKSPFVTFELADVARPQMMRAGHAEVKIPADTVPTFNADSNKIIWSIHVDGEIPHWPDIKDEFPTTVRPLPAEQIAIT